MKKIFYFFCIFCFACSYTQKIRDGKTAFERKQFAIAIPMLKKEFSASKSRVEKGKIALLIAQSYRNINQNEGATEWYKTAYDNQAGIDALRDYAYALKRNENYKEAIETFKNLGNEIGSPYEYKRDIDACLTAQNWLNNQKYYPYRIEKVSFNTKNADYSPVIFENNHLVITSDRNGSINEKNKLYKWTNRPFSDLFDIDTKNNITKPFDTKTINTTTNEGNAVFNKNFTEMFFTRCDGNGDSDFFCKIFMAKRIGDTWSEPSVLPFCQEKINYGHTALSSDGNTLYFSCNSPEGWGGYDIYAASRTKNGWDTPRILSRTINTSGNEQFPTIDGDTLYFSSDYHNGMGGLDIFKSQKLAKDNWSVPQNLKPPINSGGDDFGLVVDHKAELKNGALQVGYFTSNRNGGEGDDDIYHFEKYTPPPAPIIPTKKDTTEKKVPVVAYKLLLDGYVLEKIYENPDNPNSKILGRKPLEQAKVLIHFGKEIKTLDTDKDGHFLLEMAENTDYRFLASKTNYLNNEANFSTQGIGRDPNNPTQKFEIEIVLDKIFKNKEIILENIYYDYDKWEIRNDAKPTLDRLAITLQQNPTIKIQLSSHTDCRGNDKYNENLSQKRAQSAVDYLISKGIEPSRLLAKGYGESIPADPCECNRCNETQHQSNRRTTFKILE